MGNEIWRDVVGYEGLYQVSSIGRVKRIKRVHFNPKGPIRRYTLEKVKILKLSKIKGYARIALYKDGVTKGWFVHRLVAFSFLKPVEGKDIINHINGIKSDNRVENLEWCTQSENAFHSRRVLGVGANYFLGKKFGDHPSSKMIVCHTVDGEYVGEYDSLVRAAAHLGINKKNITGNLIGHRRTTSGYIFSYKNAS